MEIQIEEGKKQNLYVYKNDTLLYYSLIKFNFFKNNIKIFDQNHDLVFEVKTFTPFFETKYEIIFQNENKLRVINKITDNQICYNESQCLIKKNIDFFSFNQNYTYFLDEKKVGDLRQKMWKHPQKILLDISEEKVEFLDYVLIHLLVTKTGESSD